MFNPNAPAEELAHSVSQPAPPPPTEQQVLAAAVDARRRIGDRGVQQLLATFGVRHPRDIAPERRAEFMAACAPPASLTTPTAAPPSALAVRAPVTIFRNATGLLTKRATQSDGQLHLTSAAQLAEGDYRTEQVSLPELAALITHLQPNEALAFGVAVSGQPSGRVATARAINEGHAPAGAVARSKEYFAWPDGPGWLMLDVDLKDVPNAQRPDSVDQVRARLIGACPALADAPMLALPSASACLYDATTGERLRGLSGVRAYVLVAQASDIPEIGKRLHERLVLAGEGFPFISSAGRIFVRSLLDASTWSPERLDFIGGAACDAGIVQRRGEPKAWSADSAPLGLEQVPALTDTEEQEHARREAAIRDAANPVADARRAEYVAAQRAAGRTVSVTWRADGALDWLDGAHEVELDDGTRISVDEILANPTRYHGRNCADPLEPDYGGHDGRIARIYSTGQSTGPTIHSFAHGGTVYMLRPSAQLEFPANAAPPSGVQSAEEALASLVGDAGRVLLVAMAAARPEDDLWALNDRLELAAATVHPQRRILDEVVLPAAKSVRTFLSEAAQFARLLAAQLTNEPRWTSLADGDRRLLTRAAYVILAPLDQLAGTDARTPKLVARRAEPRAYVVGSVVPEMSLVGLVGPPGSGKSTIASAAGALVSTPPAVDALTGGIEPVSYGPWTAAHGSVLAFLSEDTLGRSVWRERWAAAYREPTHLHFFDGVPPLSSVSGSLAYVRSAVALVRTPETPPLQLIVIDLFRDAFQGDENSSADVGSAMATARAITRMFRCAVVLVHHSAVADEKRARGSSAFLGALDVCYAVAMRDGNITLTSVKDRGGPTGQTFRFHIDGGGVLRVGAAAPAIGDLTEVCALAVARVARQLADADSPVSRRDILAALAEERPDLFGPDVKSSTAQTRAGRGIRRACTARWITERRGKFVPGPEEPSERELYGDLSAAPADLAGVLS